MQFDGGRLFLDPQPVQAPAVALEVVMLGHCPGSANINFLLENADMRGEVEAAGYSHILAQLEASKFSSDPLFNLPVPIGSPAQFEALFPDGNKRASYQSRIAGGRAWLPQAVEDFFEQFDSNVAKKLWIINVDQALAQQGFLPQATDDWLHPDNNSAFTRALMLPNVGLMAMPDLERLQVPAQLKGVPKLRIANPVPQFLPCGTDTDNNIRERRRPHEIFDNKEPLSLGEVLAPILKSLGRYRPDMHLLMALPFDSDLSGELPQLSTGAQEDLARLKRSQLANHLHQVQLTYPYLTSADTKLISASGLLAGVMATTTALRGPWRSAAGQPLPGNYQVFPKVSLKQAAYLRDVLGLGILRSRHTAVQLDDERLSGGVFGQHLEQNRSGEVARFLGWLRRQLEQLGQQLIFSVTPGDPRPMIVLREFFTGLHQQGALRGRLPEQAFSIREYSRETALIFEIEIAPAFPIDRIRLNFSQKHLEVQRLEVKGG